MASTTPPPHPPPMARHSQLDELTKMERTESGSFQSLASSDLSRSRSEVGPKLVVFMVGLPARGKSYIVRKLKRYLSWLGFDVRIFNVGTKRRRRLTITEPFLSEGVIPGHDSAFFDPHNADAKELREQLAMETLEDLLGWLRAGGKIGIHDATNSTVERRHALIERCAREPNVSMMFVESICTDPTVLASNMRLKLSGPDYCNVPEVQALKDFSERVNNYELAYQAIGPEEEARDDMQFCQLINVGRKVIAYNIQGYLASQVVFYLMNMNLAPRQIWLTRHGESTDNVLGKIGGDAPLSERGKKYAAALVQHIERERAVFQADTLAVDSTAHIDGCHVWTSCMLRTIQTAAHFTEDDYNVQHFKFLNEIYAGDCEGLTYAQIEQRFPEEYAARQRDKLRYRYCGTGGESYLDVIERLNPLIVELERQRDSMSMVHMTVPLHTVYCIEPKPYGAQVRRFRYDDTTDCFTEQARTPPTPQ